VQCFENFGSGADRMCVFAVSTEPGYACKGGQSPGTCPMADLFGCCGTTETAIGTTAGTCYYSSSGGSYAKSACDGTSSGTVSKWVTTVP
jgi:hypothetical protein